MSEPTDDVQRRLPSADTADGAPTAGPGQAPGGPPPGGREPERSGGGLGGGLVAIGAVAAVLAAIAFVMMSTMNPAPEAATTAGSGAKADVPMPDVTMNLFKEHEGKAEALPPSAKVAVGDRLLFELSSEEPARVRLWIEEDGMTIADLGTIETDAEPSIIATDDGMLAWGFGRARTVTVRASAARSGCPAASCASQVVKAR